MADNGTRLYIHIPFCVQKCSYCDFLSFPAGEEERTRYHRALKKEIRARLAAFRKEDQEGRIASVFFGGGTPSVLSDQELADILETVREDAALCQDAEISLEANPCTLDFDKARALYEAGFHRISIGAQSMDDENLKRLGRLHDKKSFAQAYDAVRRAGFDNVNIDLIAGLPGQTPAAWERELREAADFGSEHLSAYFLELCEGTPLDAAKGKYRWPTGEELSEMYGRTETILAAYGLHRYEVSNYAKPGRECAHNRGYWTGDPYMGFGLGAASYEKQTRYTNTADMEEYLQYSGEPLKIRREIQRLEKRELESEFMILGLRLAQGVSEAAFAERFQEGIGDVFAEALGKHTKTGFLLRENGRIRLAEQALFVSNQILADFLA